MKPQNDLILFATHSWTH